MAIGCVPHVQPSPPTASPEPTIALPTSTPTISPTPISGFDIRSLTVLPGDTPHDWIVIGMLENQSRQAMTNILIETSVFDAEGVELESKTISAFLPHLSPEEASPFIAQFHELDAVFSANAVLTSYETETFRRDEVEVKILTSAPTEDSETAILGVMKNTGSYYLELHRFGLLAIDDEGSPVDLLSNATFRTILDPGEEAPFLVLSRAEIRDIELIPFIDAITTRRSGTIFLTPQEPPKLLLTEQGIPLVVGSIRNDDLQPRWADPWLVLKLEGEIVGIVPITHPLPIGPGEIRAYAINQFPGLRSQLIQRDATYDALTVEIFNDSSAAQLAEQHVLPLDLEITHFERIGSSLFLRGIVTNAGMFDVTKATVTATVRSTEGDLLSAGYVLATDDLAVGDWVEFILPLSFPQGTEPAMGEYDIKAAGLAP